MDLAFYLVGLCRSALPLEYGFWIKKAEFSKDGSWTKTEIYTKGHLKLETQVGLLTDVTLPTQQRTTSAVIMVTVQNRKPESEYEAKARVKLYDEKAGHILKKSKEKRKIEKSRNFVKFTVDLGKQQDIEKSKSKKLQLQVKVRVKEKSTHRGEWMVSNFIPSTSHKPSNAAIVYSTS